MKTLRSGCKYMYTSSFWTLTEILLQIHPTSRSAIFCYESCGWASVYSAVMVSCAFRVAAPGNGINNNCSESFSSSTFLPDNWLTAPKFTFRVTLRTLFKMFVIFNNSNNAVIIVLYFHIHRLCDFLSQPENIWLFLTSKDYLIIFHIQRLSYLCFSVYSGIKWY